MAGPHHPLVDGILLGALLGRPRRARSKRELTITVIEGGRAVTTATARSAKRTRRGAEVVIVVPPGGGQRR